MEQRHEQKQEQAFEQSLRSLYQSPVPPSFEANWQNAVLREEKRAMNEKKRSRSFWMTRALPVAAALVLVAGALYVGAGQNTLTANIAPNVSRSKTATGSTTETAMYSAGAYDMANNAEVSLAAESSTVAYDSGSTAQAPAAQDSRKLIRTVDMTIRTSDYEQDLSAIQQLLTSLGGYVENTWESGEDGAPRQAELALRVPSDKLDTFLQGVGGIGRVVNRSESTTDMTVQYADNEARLNTLRTKLERLNTLLSQAENVSDMVEIESAIADTQYAIDSYETAQRSIDRRVDMSQVSITLREDAAADNAADQDISLGQRLSAALQVSVKGIGEFFRNMLVFLVMALPVLIPVAVIVTVWVLVRRKRRAAKAQTEKAADCENEDEA